MFRDQKTVLYKSITLETLQDNINQEYKNGYIVINITKHHLITDHYEILVIYEKINANIYGVLKS